MNYCSTIIYIKFKIDRTILNKKYLLQTEGRKDGPSVIIEKPLI